VHGLGTPHAPAVQAATCLDGDTRVLMADGCLGRLADLRIGDRVYGTARGSRRRYTETEVTTHRATVGPAFRVRVEDGTELVGGADQRFLTYRGWKHVTGAQQGWQRRPHLTVGARLLGTGQFGASPKESVSYRRGYLCGLIRGDGHVGSYSCVRAGKAPWVKHGFRLALTDTDALERAREYLVHAGVMVTEFVFQRAGRGRRALMALGNQSRAGVDRIREVIRWPPDPSDAWCRGFLAGIFDAEGSCGPREALRIGNTDPAILKFIEACLSRFGFEAVREQTGRPNGMTYIRVRGGLREKLRFFHTTDPAITRKRNIEGLVLQSDTDLRVTSIEALGTALTLYSATTGSGDLIADGLVAAAAHTVPMDSGRGP
jgi:hypothetical protein